MKDIKTLLQSEQYSVRSSHLFQLHDDTGFFQAYVNSIVQLEMDVDSSTDDPETSSLRWALARVPPGSSSLPSPPFLRKPLLHRLCEILCAYRLMDVLYDLQQQESPSSFNKPSYPKQRVSMFLPTQVTRNSLKT